MATAKIQTILYHRNDDGTPDFHFHEVQPQVGPVQFIDANGIGEEGYVDGIVTDVVVMDNVVTMDEHGRFCRAFGITVHSVHSKFVFGVTVYVPEVGCMRCGDLELIEPDEGVANGPFNEKGLCTNCVEDGW